MDVHLFSRVGHCSVEFRTARIVRRLYGIVFWSFWVVGLFAAVPLDAAQVRSTNFVVTASTEPFARQVAETAETCRQKLATLWLGAELAPWSAPCPIKVKSGATLGAGGETSFTFQGEAVGGWKMSVQGTEERILDSVIPHEISHMILATYFRRPVPRWIDEGAATSIESDAERSNYRRMLVGFLRQEKGLPFNKMVRCTEYPADMMPFYAQGFSVCEYLIAVGGHRRLVEFGRTGMQTGDWSAAVREFYGYTDLGDLQTRWQNWVSEWFHRGMSGELPMVAQVPEYNRDIHGRLMVSTAATTPMFSGPSHEAASLVVRGQTEPLPASRLMAAFRSGVGSTTPTDSSAGSRVDLPVESSLFLATPGRALSEGGSSTVAATLLPAPPLVGHLLPQSYQGSYGRRSSPTAEGHPATLASRHSHEPGLPPAPL